MGRFCCLFKRREQSDLELLPGNFTAGMPFASTRIPEHATMT
jgi:hypothetical protein